MPRAPVIGVVSMRDAAGVAFEGEEVASGECAGIQFLILSAMPGGSLVVKIQNRTYCVDVYDVAEAAVEAFRKERDANSGS